MRKLVKRPKAVLRHKKDIKSKYLLKGNAVEEDAIRFAASVLGWGVVDKNVRYVSNGLMHGTCDVETDTEIHDTKCSWDCYTFPLFENQLPDIEYMYQLQGYMHLYGKKSGSIVYCLMDMPDEMINKEAFYKHGKEITKEQYEAVKAQYTHSHLPIKLRIKQFKFDYDAEIIQSIENRVFECQQYINSLVKQINL